MSFEGPRIAIGDRTIGHGQPCFVIAEAGVNHNGRLELAMALVDAAARAKADAVKFQAFRAEHLVTPDAPKAAYQARGTEAGETQFQMLKKLELPDEAQRELVAHCKSKRIIFLSTPFDKTSATFLHGLGVPAFKIGSGDITDLPLLGHVSRFGKPVLLSTGMSRLSEVEDALTALRSGGCGQVALLHCVSNYPTDAADANLRAMQTLGLAFGTPVGYSDHTKGLPVSLAAVALGACIIEKHITLDRSLPGPDQFCSIEPDEFTALVEGIRMVEVSLGSGRKQPAASEANVAAVARKSLVAARHISAGTVLTEDLISVRRPGTGLPPAMLQYVLGRKVKTPIDAGALIVLEALA
jgi:N-acetylneuraminate synthase